MFDKKTIKLIYICIGIVVLITLTIWVIVRVSRGRDIPSSDCKDNANCQNDEPRLNDKCKCCLQDGMNACDLTQLKCKLTTCSDNVSENTVNCCSGNAYYDASKQIYYCGTQSSSGCTAETCPEGKICDSSSGKCVDQPPPPSIKSIWDTSPTTYHSCTGAYNPYGSIDIIDPTTIQISTTNLSSKNACIVADTKTTCPFYLTKIKSVTFDLVITGCKNYWYSLWLSPKHEWCAQSTSGKQNSSCYSGEIDIVESCPTKIITSNWAACDDKSRFNIPIGQYPSYGNNDGSGVKTSIEMQIVSNTENNSVHDIQIYSVSNNTKTLKNTFYNIEDTNAFSTQPYTCKDGNVNNKPNNGIYKIVLDIWNTGKGDSGVGCMQNGVQNGDCSIKVSNIVFTPADGVSESDIFENGSSDICNVLLSSSK